MDGIGGIGVNLGNEIGSFYEGPFPSDTIIRNNIFRDTGRDSIRVYADGWGARARNITIENNRFSGWPESAVNLSSLDGGIIRGNTITTGSDAPSASTPVVVKDSDKLRIEDNTVHDERSQLKAAFDFSENVDGASLVMTGNQATRRSRLRIST